MSENNEYRLEGGPVAGGAVMWDTTVPERALIRVPFHLNAVPGLTIPPREMNLPVADEYGWVIAWYRVDSDGRAHYERCEWQEHDGVS